MFGSTEIKPVRVHARSNLFQPAAEPAANGDGCRPRTWSGTRACSSQFKHIHTDRALSKEARAVMASSSSSRTAISYFSAQPYRDTCFIILSPTHRAICQ